MPAKYIKNKLDKWWSRVLFRLISKSTHATRITLKLQPAEKSIKAWREWSRIMFSNGKWVFKRRFRRMLGKLPNSASMFSPTDLSERPQALFLGEMENLLRCEDEKTN